MYKIGVVGRRERILSFMAAGFEIYEAHSAADAAHALKTAKNDGCAVIFLAPELAGEMSEELARYAGDEIPAIIPLPTPDGGFGIEQLKHAVERAVGADIIFKDN